MQEVKINTPFAYELLICVSNRDVTFWAHHLKNDEFLCINTSNYIQLNSTIQESINISDEFSGIKIVYSSTEVCLVPTPIFEADSAEKLYGITHSLKNNEVLLNTNISNANATILFAVDKKVQDILTEKFAGATIYHEVGVFLDAIQQTDEYCINVRLDRDRLTLAITNKQKLVLANSFNYNQPEDAVYFILNACEQLGINHQMVKGNIINVSDSYWNTVLLIQDYCPEIKTAAANGIPEFENTEADNGLLLFNLAKCE